MATAMFRLLRCFNNSTSERPTDGLLVVVLGVASAKKDGDADGDDEGLEIDTTSPNCAEDAEELFRCIGATSPNCTPGGTEAVAFAMALVPEEDSSFASSVSLELEYNRIDRGLPFDFIRVAVLEVDGSDGVVIV